MMVIDRIDIIREDEKKSETKRVESKRQTDKSTKSHSFLARYQTKLKAKETKEARTNVSKDVKSKQNKQLFARVVETLKGKEEGKEQAQKEFKKDFQKKQDEKRDRAADKSDTRHKPVSEEGHGRVTSKQSHHQEGERGGKGSYSGGGGQERQGGERGGSFSGSSGSQKQSYSGKGSALVHGKIPAAVKSVKSFSADTEGRSTGGGAFSQKTLDEVVESVRIGINEEGEKEMDVQLSDEYFSGLRLKATRSPNGVILTFICPNREVKNTFLIKRAKIYTRLREKNIAVYRIDVL